MGYYNPKPEHRIGEKCVYCSAGRDKGGIFIERKGPYGAFLGCSRYPDCKGVAKMTAPKLSRRQKKLKATKHMKHFGRFKDELDAKLAHLHAIKQETRPF